MIRSTAYLLAFALACTTACKSSDEKPAMSVEEEAAVDFARKNLPELDKLLASDDPGAASSTCSVIEVDMAHIEKVDAKLAATIKTKCGRDVAIRTLEEFVKKAEKARTESPDDKFLMECASFKIYMKPVIAAGVEGEPEVAKLRERFVKACPDKG